MIFRIQYKKCFNLVTLDKMEVPGKKKKKKTCHVYPVAPETFFTKSAGGSEYEKEAVIQALTLH